MEIPQSEGVSLKAFYAKQGRLQRSQKPSTERIVLSAASDFKYFSRLYTFWNLRPKDKSFRPTKQKSGQQGSRRRAPVLVRDGLFMMVLAQSRHPSEI